MAPLAKRLCCYVLPLEAIKAIAVMHAAMRACASGRGGSLSKKLVFGTGMIAQVEKESDSMTELKRRDRGVMI